MKSLEDKDNRGFLTLTGRLSGKTIRIPDVPAPPIPSFVAPGVIHDGIPAEGFGSIGSASHGCPDSLSFRRRFGLLVPATDTIMEQELWGMIFANQGPYGLHGVGIRTTTVAIPRPEVGTAEGLENFKEQFLGGLESAATKALLAPPQYQGDKPGAHPDGDRPDPGDDGEDRDLLLPRLVDRARSDQVGAGLLRRKADRPPDSVGDNRQRFRDADVPGTRF